MRDPSISPFRVEPSVETAVTSDGLTSLPFQPRERAQRDPRHAILRDLGLSDYAARAYLALIELGEAEARDVSRLGKVPIAKVYNTLDQLAQKGFCTVLPEMPKRYAPEPMERIMQRIEQAHIEEAARARTRASELATLFPLAPKDHAGDRGGAIVLRGRTAMLDKCRTLAKDARELLVLTSDGMLERERRQLETTPGVATRLLHLTAPGRAPPVMPAGAVGRSLARVRDSPSAVSFRAYDERAVLLCHHVPDDPSEHLGQDVSILVTEQALVRALRDVMERLWASAQPSDGARGSPSLGV